MRFTLRNHILLPALSAFVFLHSAASGLPARAQPAPERAGTAQPAPADAESGANSQVPVLPETTVVGRPNPFPAAPLQPDTVLTPARNEVYRGEVGSAYTIITGEEIRRSQQATVGEVLRSVPGLNVVRQGGPGGLTTVFMRGANSQHTKVLLDGIPINDPSNATRLFDFSTLSTDNIERIEVLRGPQSVLYGSDAIGGVVHIITRRGEGPPTASVSAEGGSFGTGRTVVSSSGGGDRAYYSISGSYLHTDGISAASERLGNTEKDFYENQTVSGRFGWIAAEKINVDYVFRYADLEAEIDDFDFFSGLPVDNPLRANLAKVFHNRIQIEALMLDDLVEQTVGFNVADYDRLDTDPGPFAPAEFLGQTRSVDWQANLLLTESNTFTAGASYLHEQASTSFEPQAQQFLGSAFVEDQIRILDRWFTTVGFRWDDHSRAGNAETYRVTSIFHIFETGAALHGTLGTGFRAPALAENFFAFGNPNLRPEESKGWDVGLTQNVWQDLVVVDATYFRNDFENLIVFDFDTFALENVGQARATGVELTSTMVLTEVSTLSANYTLTDTVDLETGRELLRRPRHKAAVSLLRQIARDRGSLEATLLYVGDRLDTRNTVLDEYFLLNLTSRYRLNRRWELFGRLDNVLDEDYEEVRGFGVPGIAGYAGATAQW